MNQVSTILRGWLSNLVLFRQWVCIVLVGGLGLCAHTETLSADAQTAIGMLGIWDRAKPLVERASRETGIPVRQVGVEDSLEDLAILFVLNMDSEVASRLATRLQNIHPRPLVIPLDRRDGHTGLIQEGLLHEDSRIPLYWRANGLENMGRLLTYTAITYLGQEGEVEAPMVIPEAGYYHPELKEIIGDIADYRRQRPPVPDGTPTAALLIHQSFWITGDTAVIDALILSMEQKGFDVVCLFAQSDALRSEMLEAVRPELLVEQRHASGWDGGLSELMDTLGGPLYLRPISMLASTIDEWRADPQGLKHRDRSNFLTLQESLGILEPIVVGGMVTTIQGFRLHEPIPDRVDRFVNRAWNWWQLRRKVPGEKRVAIIYFNKYLGKSDLMRGSPTGAFLDGPASLLAFLPRMKEAGYTVGPLPADVGELMAWMKERGRNIGPWAGAELEKMADHPESILVPLPTYQKWFEQRLSESNQREVITHFGPPPGKLMVVERNGIPQIVIPAIQLGNVLLAPQPARGAEQDEALLHSRDVPPPHNYLAFYWWLQEDFQADAIIHWGTHGSLELLPGKEAGLSSDDWSDVCAGDMPVLNSWIMDNIGEATLSRRRSHALLVDHLPPPSVQAGVTDELEVVHDDIHKFKELDVGILREEFRRTITGITLEEGIDKTLGFEVKDRLLSDKEIDKVASHVHEIESTTTPSSLHILGQLPGEERMVPYLVTILGKDFIDRLSHVEDPGFSREDEHHDLPVLAEELVRRTVFQGESPPPALVEDIEFARDMLGRLRKCELEIKNLLLGLSGRYVPPGPGPDPIRNPASVPSGRNLYGLNPKEIPTPTSWKVAVQLVRDLLKDKNPGKVGFDLNGMNTMRDYGIVEGQILYLLGVRPVWDHNQLAVDVELIPREELGRPRVDVFVAMGGNTRKISPVGLN
jgi:cobaltochelatase CobN